MNQPPNAQVGSPRPDAGTTGRRFLVLFLAVIFACACAGTATVWFLYRMYQTLPTLDQLENIEPPLSSKVMGKDGSLIHEFSIERRSWVSLKDVPKNLVNAVIAIEDRKFYSHWGVDIKRIVGAVFVNVGRRHYAQGASTLTQQLARNVYLSSKTSMIRKIRRGNDGGANRTVLHEERNPRALPQSGVSRGRCLWR